MDPAADNNSFTIEEQPLPEGEAPPYIPHSPVKKIILMASAVVILLFAGSGILFLASANRNSKGETSTPPVAPSVVPPTLAPTMPLATNIPVSPTSSGPLPTGNATSSASIKPSTGTAASKSADLGRLAFIKDGDIYTSDFNKYSLFIKNQVPAGKGLKWATDGKNIAWIPQTETSTSSALFVYNIESSTFTELTLPPEEEGITAFAWSPTGEKIAMLSARNPAMSVFSLKEKKQVTKTKLNPEFSYKNLIWPKEEILLVSGEGGIDFYSSTSSSFLKLLNEKVHFMKESPNGGKILYSVGDEKSSDLYVADLEGSNRKKLDPFGRLDLSDSRVEMEKIRGGFIPYGLWFPKGDRLLVGYHYFTNLPLAAVYDFSDDTITAISPFLFYSGDIFTDDLRLAGARILDTGKAPIWNLSIFTLEDNLKFGIIRTIPGAYSPTFYFGE